MDNIFSVWTDYNYSITNPSPSHTCTHTCGDFVPDLAIKTPIFTLNLSTPLLSLSLFSILSIKMRSSFPTKGVLNMSRRKRRVKISSTERRLKQLRKLIPAAGNSCSETLNLENLYQMTESYIFFLQAKVNLLKSLSSFYGV